MDPFSTLIALLRPQAVDSKLMRGSAAYDRVDNFGFGVVLEGQARIWPEGLELRAGDFVLMPPNDGFSMEADSDLVLLGGVVEFETAQIDLLRSLLPRLVHVRGSRRLGMLVELVREEAIGELPGRELILQKLVEILLVEAFRKAPSSGLLRGLADPELSAALQCMHQQPAHGWTLAELAGRAHLSRSAFCLSFQRTVGLPPREYLVQWRMTLAKDLLARRVALKTVAETVGYGSASAFSTAFRRQFGHSPGSYAPGCKT